MIGEVVLVEDDVARPHVLLHPGHGAFAVVGEHQPSPTLDRSGVFSKSGHEIPLERVNDITSKQSVFERLIGAGDLQIQSGGGDVGPQVIPNMKKPFAVQNEIYRQMEAAQARDADRMAGRRELSVPEQLEKLDELRQRGVLSQAEFDAKKAQLLDRM